jgi:hypothetical protein
MKMALPQLATPHSHAQPPSSLLLADSVSATLTAMPTADIQHFEGDTSLSAYTTSTNDHLQQALRNTQLLQQAPDLAAALISLSQIVSTQNLYPGEHGLLIGKRNEKNTQKYGVPPAEVVSRVLRECEDVYDTAIMLLYPVGPFKKIVALCKELYFNIDDIPVASLIVAFGSLYFVFRYYRFSFSKDDPRQETFHQYSTMFVQNMTDLISLLPVLMEPTIDNFEALVLGVSAESV